MADEPRRSGRATKGQHTKNVDDDTVPASKRGAKGKGKDKNSKDEPEEEDEEADDSIIRCVCGATEDEDGWPMICCDKCEAWQHNLCMGITELDDELPEQYFCEQCRPQDHKDLLAAMKRGEEPWEARIAQRRKEEKEAEKNKKKGKGKRKSGSAKETPVKASPTPDAGNKRKFEDTQAEVIKKSASPVVTVTPTITRRNTQLGSDVKRRKSAAGSVDIELIDSIDKLPADRKKVAAAVSTKIKQAIATLVKSSSYRIPDGETGASLGDAVALRIEHALMTVYGNPNAYAEQFRTINFNFPKNPQLVAELLNNTLTALELAEMSADDMATEALQKHRAAVREEADKQAILITEQGGPRMRKTHKGDEIIGGEDLSRPNDDASWANQPIRRREQPDEVMTDAVDGVGSPHDMPELPEDAVRPPLTVDTSGSPTNSNRKSSNFNLNRAWQSAHSPDKAYGATQTPRVQQSQPAHSPDTQMHDADIDRLLKDEDSDGAMSPVVAAGPSVWTGTVDMVGVASFTASARWVAGGDVGQKISYKSLLPETVQITGRIPIQRADQYVAEMRYSTTNDVCCLALSPSTPADSDAFKKIFDYFHSRERWGVVNTEGLHEALKDVYMIPLKKGSATYPDFMSMLEERQVEEPRRKDMLVLNIVVKTKSPTSTPQIPQSDTASLPIGAPQPSPVVVQGNGFSPTPVLPHQPPHVPQHAPAPSPGLQSNHSWATPNVKRILGVFTFEPAVVQLFTAVPDMTEQQLVNLREAMEREPSTREDLGKLAVYLQREQQT